MAERDRSAVLAAWRDRLSWRSPSDRQAAEAAIRAVYEVAGLDPPERILWASGPEDARRLIGRLGWRSWLPWLGLLAVPLVVLGEIMAVRQGLWPAGLQDPLSTLVATLGAVVLITALWSALLLGSPVSVAQLRAWHAGLLVYSLVLLAGLALPGDPLRALPVTLLLGGFILAPSAAVLVSRFRDGGNPPHCRAGRPVTGRINRTLWRSLRGAAVPVVAFLPERDVAARFDAFQELLNLLLPPYAPVVAPLGGASHLVRAQVAAPNPAAPQSQAARDFVDLAFRVDALWAYSRVAVALAPPEAVQVDEQGRLHSTLGPAARWGDGCELFAVAGRFAGDRGILVAPHALTMAQIRLEPDPDIRRVLIERYGPEKLMRHRRARRLAVDETGELWRYDDFDGEPLVMVRVRNSTPEPDGTHRFYWLRVPPYMVTPREAVAWTFGFSAAHYRPTVET